MSKILSLLLVMVVASFATAPTHAVTNGNYTWAIDTTISSAAGFDTVGGAADSATIVTLRAFQPGYEYILVRDAITGGGSDSVKLSVSVRCFNASATHLYTVEIDSFTAAAGEAVLIPIGGTCLGSKFTIKAMSYTDNGGVVILNRIAIFKRRVISVVKDWAGN